GALDDLSRLTGERGLRLEQQVAARGAAMVKRAAGNLQRQSVEGRVDKGLRTARRHPGGVVVGAVVAGCLLVRLLRSCAVARHAGGRKKPSRVRGKADAGK